MKVIIAGSREITNKKYVFDCIDKVREEINISEIVSGNARGVDTLGEEYAKLHNIKIIEFPAQWNIYGKSAGYKRNVVMAEYADALIVIHNNSKGSIHMRNIAKDKNLIVYEFRQEEKSK